MIKTLIASGAGLLLIAGVASCTSGEPASETVVVREVPWHPSMSAAADSANTNQGMMSADEMGMDTEALFGFKPSTLIYVWDEPDGIRITSQPVN